jgi:hypothetical protein
MLETIIAIEIALWIFYYANQLKQIFMEIIKLCIKCKDPADVIEKGKDYCVECWFEHIEGKKFEDVKKEIEEEERFIKKPKE